MNVDFIIALGYIVPMLDERFGHFQRKPVAQAQWSKRVVLSQESQVIITVIKYRNFTLVDPGPSQQTGNAVVPLATICCTRKMGGSFEQLLDTESLHFDLCLRTLYERIDDRDFPVHVALTFMTVRVEIAVKFCRPALQRAETAGDTSEFSIAEGNLSQGDVLIRFDGNERIKCRP